MQNVLVVHGDKDSARAISSAIGRVFQVSRSSTVEDVVALVAAGHRFDAIVCAPELPDGSSEELRCRLLSRHPSQAAGVVPFPSDGQFLLDGNTRGGFFLKRTAAQDLIDELVTRSAPLAA